MNRMTRNGSLLAFGLVAAVALPGAFAQMGGAGQSEGQGQGQSQGPAQSQGQAPGQGHAHMHDHAAEGDPQAVREHAHMFRGLRDAVAVLLPTEGNRVYGEVRFRDSGEESVEITYRIGGLEPNGTHAFHIHQYGDLTAPDGTSLGGHYNPDGHDHGLPEDEQRHAGDFGNIEADAQGVAEGSFTAENITVAGLRNPIIGRGLVVHAQRDTGEGESGEAGARIGVAVIGIAQDQNGN